jgi:hypothetical protein
MCSGAHRRDRKPINHDVSGTNVAAQPLLWHGADGTTSMAENSLAFLLGIVAPVAGIAWLLLLH